MKEKNEKITWKIKDSELVIYDMKWLNSTIYFFLSD